MKRKIYILFFLFSFMALFFSGCARSEEKVLNENDEKKDKNIHAALTVPIYRDGVYEGKTDVDYENYYSRAKVTIKNKRISNVEWEIFDKSKNMVFDENYEKIFKDSKSLVEQCRSNLKGVKAYGKKLLEVQDIERVDVITGATWTNKMFKAAVKDALKNAIAKN
ncbi:MAG: FMN-binding protein [Clostridia bacterium]|nr:FMN-binding protein [Clostridia bacterium]